MKKTVEFQKSQLLLSKIPANLRQWLMHKDSFMDRLRSHGVMDSTISVLQQCWQQPDADEREALQSSYVVDAWIREVLIMSEHKQWMFARTVVPRQTLTNNEVCLLNLENKSLGSVLFNDPSMQRSDFMLAQVCCETDWHQKITRYVNKKLPAIWVRRSTFTIKQKPLLLTEFFLPDIAELKK